MVGNLKAHWAAASAVLMAFSIVVMSAQGARAAACANAEEQTALEIRVLQSELMVGALSCSKRDLYSQFVEKFKPVLADRGTSLRMLFQRRHGDGAKRELDRFTTRLANGATQRSQDQPATYCARSTQLLKRALALGPADLAAFAGARPAAQTHGIESCQ